MHVIASKVLTTLAFLTALSTSQTEYGKVELPLTLADAGSKVLGVLNKNPTTDVAFGYCEGPTTDSTGSLYFAQFDPSNDLKSTIWKVPTTGPATVFYSSSEGSNGMEFDPQGRLVVCQNQAVRRINSNGTTVTLAANGNGIDLHRVNDLSIGSTGAMYFTNHATGNEVFFMDATGKIKTFNGVAKNFVTPNGVEWIEEKKLLYVTLDGPAEVYRYDVNDDGTLKNERVFASVKEPDGLTVDERGNVYIASYNDGAVLVFDSTGNKLGTITIKSANPSLQGPSGNASNCTIGGPDKKTLYITGNGGTYKVQLRVGGRKRPEGVVSIFHRDAHLAPSRHLDLTALKGASVCDAAGRDLSRDKLLPMGFYKKEVKTR